MKKTRGVRQEIVDAIILRDGRVLARPSGDSRGVIPSLSDKEIIEGLTVVDVSKFGNLLYVPNSMGTPDGWRWLTPAALQAELPQEMADAVGELLLCA